MRGGYRAWFIVNRFFGFIILSIATLVYFLKLEEVNSETVGILVFLILLGFAWTDYSKFIIRTSFGVATFLAFFGYVFESLFYAIPFFMIFLVYAYLLSIDKERKAFYLSMVSIPIAIVYSYLIPDASPVTWAFIGLMLAYNHHVIIEDMAIGDIYIIPIYFMVLGPFALIPYSVLYAVGEVLYYSEAVGGFPVAPSLFVTGIPLYMIMLEHGISPFTFHSINTHPSLAAVLFLIAFIYISYLEAKQLLSGIVAGITGLLLFFGYAMGLRWVSKEYHLSEAKLALLALLGLSMALGVAWIIWKNIKIHYHGFSTVDVRDINILLWLCLAISIGLTIYIVKSAISETLSIVTLAFSVVFAILRIKVSDEYILQDPRFRAIEGALAGFWLGVLLSMLH